MNDFIFPVRVYYEDTDSLGIMYHPNYLKFMERARTEILRKIDPKLFTPQAAALFVVAELQLKYLRPSYLGDTLNVSTQIVKVSYASMVFVQKVLREQQVNCTGEIKVVCVDKSMRPCALPAHLKKSLEG